MGLMTWKELEESANKDSCHITNRTDILFTHASSYCNKSRSATVLIK